MTLYKLALALLSREHTARLGVCLLILGLLPSALGSNEIPKVEQVELQPLGCPDQAPYGNNGLSRDAAQSYR